MLSKVRRALNRDVSGVPLNLVLLLVSTTLARHRLDGIRHVPALVPALQ